MIAIYFSEYLIGGMNRCCRLAGCLIGGMNRCCHLAGYIFSDDGDVCLSASPSFSGDKKRGGPVAGAPLIIM